MGAYILRRLLLVIPTLLGVMIINFALTQFVPGGPIEQIIANMEGTGDVFESISGGGSENLAVESDDGGSFDGGGYVGARGLPKEFIEELEREFEKQLPDRIMQELASLEDSLSGYQVTRLEHSLISATMAEADGADLDWIVAALVHDIGDGLAPQNHDRMSAEVIRPIPS